ncbi:MAG: hypothetical protein JNL58_28995 [Planctomyces sp.]|nr:hypothetical protein [Planctomyces sp.]
MFGFLKRPTKSIGTAYRHQLQGLISELHQRAAEVPDESVRQQLTAELVEAEAEYGEVIRHLQRASD